MSAPRQGDLFGTPPPLVPAAADEPRPAAAGAAIDALAAPNTPAPADSQARRRPAPRKAPRAGAETTAGARFAAVADVAVASHAALLTWGVPPALTQQVVPGMRVTVPLQGRLVTGVVWAVRAAGADGPVTGRLRPIVACPDAPPLPPDLLHAIEFAARYWLAPLGSAVRLALPAPLRRTGVDGDLAPERRQWLVEPTNVRPWPDGLSRPELRLLARIEAAGTTTLPALRRLALRDPAPEADAAGLPEVHPPRAVPAPLRLVEGLAARGLCRLWQERVLRDPFAARAPTPPDVPPVLTPEQNLALQRMRADLEARRWGGHLLRGITGSGKTEVYLRLIATALDQGRGAIVLVPEIALTPQLVRRFRARFGDQVAALHSGLGDGERLDQWTRLERGERRIVVGPRSALFAPVRDLGVIVVDECHDASFKQQTGLRYHARDLALVRARAAHAVAVLGSATPGCEEMALVHDGRLHLTELSHRPLGGALPLAATLDLRTVERVPDPGGDRPSLLSRPLLDAVVEVVRRGEQAMLLHNRRGFAPSMICMGCGGAVECVDCAVSLTLHRAQQRLRCHLCDFSMAADVSCPRCRGRHLVGIGAGTERIETTLAHFAPGLRIARFDRDTATGQRLHDTLDRFARRELDVLVGTQMLAKGHDFPAVTLVGVLLAEQGLRIPDFRAAERTFQLLTQVAGRAGRGERPGRVLVQTWMPDHPAIAAALRHDHPGFLQSELAYRHAHRWPPHTHVALIEARHADVLRARAAVTLAVDHLRRGGVEVRGPVMAGIARLRGQFRVHALARGDDRALLHEALRRVQREVLAGIGGGVDVSLDIDPTQFS